MCIRDRKRTSHMQYTHLGRSGLSVSRLCLGTMNFGPQTEEGAAHFGTVRLHHRTVGDLELDFETLALPDDGDQSLRIYTTKPGSPSHDALRLLSSWAHSESNSDNPLLANPPSENLPVDASPTGSESKHSPQQ